MQWFPVYWLLLSYRWSKYSASVFIFFLQVSSIFTILVIIKQRALLYKMSNIRISIRVNHTMLLTNLAFSWTNLETVDVSRDECRKENGSSS